MAQELLSPPTHLLSDEDEAVSPLFESTAADLVAGLRKDLLAEFSTISPGPEGDQTQVEEEAGKVKVYLRVRPLMPSEVDRHEEQGCVVIENAETLVLQAPKKSFAMKSTERGVGQATHRFTFSQVFGPDVGQASFFNLTVREMVREVLSGQNRLIYTYGVTNSGKTHTVQGTQKDGGILPRSLALIFSSIRGQLAAGAALKPLLSHEVVRLDGRQGRQEEARKQALLSAGSREATPSSPPLPADRPPKPSPEPPTPQAAASFDSGIAGLSSSGHASGSQLEEPSARWAEAEDAPLRVAAAVRFSVWVSFFEIYNELIYDLLELPGHKRQTLRLCEDHKGNPYVKDLSWVNVRDADEAWKLLRVGRMNQTFASTHLNHNSSRSHSIFSIRILHLQGDSEVVLKISELSLCDLAGSERCKEQKTGERLKEAGSINTSLHTLGRCIAALRQNQQARPKPSLVPFRDSKLTRVFQGFFTGRGRSCMIVNVNPCASTYDETLHVAKFSALASQLVHAPPVKLGLFIKSHSSLLAAPGQGKAARRGPVSAEEDEEEEEESSGDEEDFSLCEKEKLLQVVDALKKLLLQERREKLQLEMQLRNEICNEVVEQMREREQWYSEHLDTQKELLEDLYEDKLKNLKESLTTYYREELRERDEQVEELEAALREARQQAAEAGLPVRRSQRVAAASGLQELQEAKAKLAHCQEELSSAQRELHKYQKMLEPPPSPSKSFASDVDRKLEEGQKNVRLLRAELEKLGQSFQSAERVCCHSTGAGKLRQALATCDDILVKQDQTLAELQNNLTLLKLDLRKTAGPGGEGCHAGLRPPAPAFFKKRQGPNQENVQPGQQPPGKRPFLHGFLNRTPSRPVTADSSPYVRILRSRRSPLLKSGPFGRKY
ncbi:kinesin-like protein KIF20A [Tachyglossus aculeatus]|uniref:kinesin-like protein KIF20A n=1 Tax=Tachyglossus aculeatus TaxID=9261 RepID=UPI0018F54F8F|nr:kinesin-like protein KIF20A [Tachyglossus aculeatus]XP_038627150.1 kinesin-like protein KIF20A [Tachyglossus aculeatus]